MSIKDSKKTQNNTRIDLAEDLLLETEINIKSAESFLSESNPKELLRSAKILKSEGLVAEAKKAFLGVLRLDPKNTQAKKLLEEIQEYEFKDLFIEENHHEREKYETSDSDIDEVIHGIENDLGIDLSFKKDDANRSEIIFSEEAGSLSVEMLYDGAMMFYGLESFEKCLFLLDKILLKLPETQKEKKIIISAIELKSIIYTEQRRYFEVIQLLEKETLKDHDINFDKSHFYYLLSKAYLQTGRLSKALIHAETLIKKKEDFKDIKKILKKIKNQIKLGKNNFEKE